MHLRPGTRIADRYEIVGEEGEGPAWRAYFALDHDVEVECSLWLVRPECLPDDDARRRFVAQLGRVRGVTHPALRRVHDVGAHESTCYVSQQRLVGQTLATYAGAGARLGVPDLVRLGRRLAEPLAAAHAASIVHGRFTPGDVLLIDGQPKLTGVGFWPALAPGASRAAWASGAPYLAPEVARGEPATAAADVYALALVLSELALGAVAPMGETGAAMIDRLERDQPTLALALAPGLAADPARRPADPLALVARLTAAPGGGSGVDDDAPTTHYLSLEGTPAPKTADFPDDEVAPPPIERTPPPVPTVELTPPPIALPLAPPQPFTPAAPRPALLTPPTIRTPRAPTHREADAVLPALPPLPPPRARRGFPRWALMVCGLAVVASGGALVAALTGTPAASAPAASADAAPAPAPRRDAAPAPLARSLAPCPKDMVLVEDKPSVCVDAFEAPGEGFVPATDVTVDQARAACAARGRRLCTAAEWERACRGPHDASWPYGSAYAPPKCNVRAGARAALAKAGAFAGCVSAAGAHDMSGNAAEWIDDGTTRGGSAADRDDGRCSRATRRAAGFAAADVGYRCCAAPGAY